MLSSLISIYLFQYAERYITLCYVHPEDLKEPNLSLKFLKQSGKEEYSIAKVSLPQWYHDIVKNITPSSL